MYSKVWCCTVWKCARFPPVMCVCTSIYPYIPCNLLMILTGDKFEQSTQKCCCWVWKCARFPGSNTPRHIILQCKSDWYILSHGPTIWCTLWWISIARLSLSSCWLTYNLRILIVCMRILFRGRYQSVIYNSSQRYRHCMPSAFNPIILYWSWDWKYPIVNCDSLITINLKTMHALTLKGPSFNDGRSINFILRHTIQLRSQSSLRTVSEGFRFFYKV